MPEGHTIHRRAADCRERFGGRPLRADSPQGVFADGAARVDGRPLTAAEAHGKHLFLGFEGAGWVHIHLGLYGSMRFGSGPPPPPAGAIRLRLVAGGESPETGADGYAELRGPKTCALLSRGGKQAVRERLGPDPLRADAEPERAFARLARSRAPLAQLLLDQQVLAGVGNVYRAEVLFRQGIDPYRPGRELSRAEWDALWDDLVALLREGVRVGRIDTVRPRHTPRAMGRPPRVDGHGGEVYVYRRAGRACHVCGGAVRSARLAGRNLFWCPTCQPA